jgi:hypothetical protein
MNCADARDRLSALLYGDLPGREADRVREHLTRCPSCEGEYTAISQVRRLLDTVPAPALAVDLPRLYREAAERQARRLRRWRRLAVGALAAAAALLAVVFLSRLEVRLDANQLVLRWGDVPAPVPMPPAPGPIADAPAPVAPPSATASSAEVEQQLRLLAELVQALSQDADRQEERRREEIARLRGQMQLLQQQMTELRLATEKDVSALYAAQFPEREKGTQR